LKFLEENQFQPAPTPLFVLVLLLLVELIQPATYVDVNTGFGFETLIIISLKSNLVR